MWKILLLLCCAAVRNVASEQVMVQCEPFNQFPTNAQYSPSEVADLKLKRRLHGERCMVNVSWAISIDASTKYQTGTRISITGEQTYLCKYEPSLTQAEFSEPKQWFHYEVPVGCYELVVLVDNLPLPPHGSKFSGKHQTIDLTDLKPVEEEPPEPSSETTPVDVTSVPPTAAPLKPDCVLFAVFGGLAGLLSLAFFYIICMARRLGFQRLATSATQPVPVLVVYSAQDSAFQQAVVALVEFLQCHGGCSVAVDMWQQGKIAELGPMRWLLEQIEAADRVLVVCPQGRCLPLEANLSPSNQRLPQASIPAATHDLYPLVLNIFASTAKNPSEHAKFWVVQLGEQQDRRPSSLAPQLQTCRTFRLMKNLNKLCRSLHAERQDNRKSSEPLFRPGICYNEVSTAKLREAVKTLMRHQPRDGTSESILMPA